MVEFVDYTMLRIEFVQTKVNKITALAIPGTRLKLIQKMCIFSVLNRAVNSL